MNIDELGEEQVIDEDFHGVFDEILFQDLVADEILDPDLNINNLNMEGGRHGAGQEGPKRIMVVDPVLNLTEFSGEKNESVDNYLDVFDDNLEIQQINVAEASVAQRITKFGFSLFGKTKKGVNQGREGRHTPLLQNGIL